MSPSEQLNLNPKWVIRLFVRRETMYAPLLAEVGQLFTTHLGKLYSYLSLLGIDLNVRIFD